MKKLTGVIIGAICVLWVFSTASYAQSMKIGTIDLSRVFDNYERTKEDDEKLAEKTRIYEAERDAKLEKIRAVQGRLALLKEGEKEAAQKEFEALRADFLEYDQAQRTDLGKERDEKIRTILLEIEQTVKAFAESNNYDVILNDRVLVYGNPGMDVSEQILKKINDNYNKK